MAATSLEDAPTRLELAEAMAHVVDTLKRMPSHWTDRRAALHDSLNDLLDEYESTPA